MTEYTLSLTVLGKDKASGMFDRLDRSLKTTMQTALGMTIARVFEDIGAAIGRMAISAVNAISYVQNLQVVLSTLMARELYMAGDFDTVSAAMGDANIAAEQLVHDLGRFAILSPYTMEATTNMFRLMMAFGSTSDQSTLLTKGLMTMGAGLGANNEQIQRMAYNLAQIQLEGKVTALDIRQLALAGLPLNDVLKSVGKQFGVNIETHEDFNKALAEGKITWQQFSEGFAKYAEENFGGASERMARTLSGLKSTFSDVFTLTMPRILGPAVEEVTGILSNLLDAFLYIYEDPRLAEIGTKLAEKVHKWIAPVRDAVSTFTNALAGGADILTAGKELASSLGAFFKDTVGQIVQSLALALPGVTTWVADFATRMLTGFATKLPKVGTFIVQVMQGVFASLIAEAPELISSFASVWLSFGTTLIAAAPQLIASVTGLIGQLATGIVTNLPKIAETGLELVTTLANGLGQNIPVLLTAVGSLIMALLGAIGQYGPNLFTMGAVLLIQFISGLAQMAPAVAGTAVTVLSSLLLALLKGIPALLSAGVQLIVGLALGLAGAIPALLKTASSLIPQLVMTLLQNIPLLINAGMQLLFAVAIGLVTSLTTISASMGEIVNTIITVLAASLPQLLIAGVQIIAMLATGILSNLPAIVSAAVSLIAGLVSVITANLPLLLALGVQLLITLVIGIVQALPSLVTAAMQIIQLLLNSVSVWVPMLIQLGATLVITLVEGLMQALPSIASAAIDIVVTLLEGLAGLGQGVFQAGADLFAAFKQGFTSGDWSGFTDVGANLFGDNGFQLTGTEWGNQLRTGLKQGLPALQTTMQEGVTGINDWMSGSSFFNLDNAGAALATSMGTGWSTQYPTTANLFTTDLMGLSTSLSTQPTNLQNVGAGFATGMQLGWTNQFPTLSTSMMGDLSTLTGKSDAELWNMMMPLGGQFGTGIGEGWDTAFPGVQTTIGSDLAGFPEVVGNSLKGTTTTVGTSLIEDIGVGFDTAFPPVKTQVATGVADLTDSLEPEDTTPIGTNIIGGISDGLEGAFPGLLARARQMAAEIAAAMEVELEISSPSRVFSRMGEQIPRGLAMGITKREQLPLDAVSRVAELMTADTRARSLVQTSPSTVYNYNLTMPTSNSPADVGMAFDLMRALGGLV